MAASCLIPTYRDSDVEAGQTYRASDTLELRDMVAAAAANGVALEPRAGGSKATIGCEDRERAIVDLTAICGIVDYEPGELVLSVRPATPLAEVEALLDANDQMLAFEPWDHSELFGQPGGKATIGGIFAAGVSGPRRLSAGGARDHLLGFSAVSGRAEAFKAGGKVVKNVTGYDLSKVMVGSWGQLAVMTELSIKVVPKPKASATLILHGLPVQAAVQRMAEAMGSVAGPAAAAYIPDASGSVSQTLLRVEGFAPSVTFRVGQLQSILGHPASDIVTGPEAGSIWQEVRLAGALGDKTALWRVLVAPSRAVGLAEELGQAGVDWVMDWAGALLWAGGEADVDIHAIALRHEGHAMLVRAPRAVSEAFGFRRFAEAGATALSQRVKRGFDPAGILDPMRFG